MIIAFHTTAIQLQQPTNCKRCTAHERSLLSFQEPLIWSVKFSHNLILNNSHKLRTIFYPLQRLLSLRYASQINSFMSSKHLFFSVLTSTTKKTLTWMYFCESILPRECTCELYTNVCLLLNASDGTEDTWTLS